MSSGLNLLSTLATLQREMQKAIEHGQKHRAKDLIIDFEKSNPNLSALIRAAFTGTPEEILKKIERWFPGVRELPGVDEFVAGLQSELMKAWEKKR